MKRFRNFKHVFCLMMTTILILTSAVHAAAAGSLTNESGSAAESIKPTVSVTGSKTEFEKSKVYQIQVQNDSEKTYKVPISISKDSILDFELTNTNNLAVGTAGFYITSDTELQDIKWYDYLYMDESDSLRAVAILPKGDYYFIISIESKEDTDAFDTLDTFDFTFRGLLYQTGAKTLKNKTWTIAVGENKAVYHKIVVKKDSILSITGDPLNAFDDIYVTLCDSKKKAISTKEFISGEEQLFAVSKGTYYFKTTTNSIVYYLYPELKTVSDKSGTSQTKSRKISPKTLTTGLITATDAKNKIDYYKMTTTKKGQFDALEILYYGQGSIQITIKAPGLSTKKVVIEAGDGVSYKYMETVTNSYGSYTREGNYPKGTYYITVRKLGTKSSGYYTINTK